MWVELVAVVAAAAAAAEGVHLELLKAEHRDERLPAEGEPLDRVAQDRVHNAVAPDKVHSAWAAEVDPFDRVPAVLAHTVVDDSRDLLVGSPEEKSFFC